MRKWGSSSASISDVACKAETRSAPSSAPNPLDAFAPTTGATRDAVHDFLVANAATFKLITVFQSSIPDAGIMATLNGSKCSPRDARRVRCALLKALDGALQTFMATPPPTDADYATLVAGRKLAGLDDRDPDVHADHRASVS